MKISVACSTCARCARVDLLEYGAILVVALAVAVAVAVALMERFWSENSVSEVELTDTYNSEWPSHAIAVKSKVQLFTIIIEYYSPANQLRRAVVYIYIVE